MSLIKKEYIVEMLIRDKWLPALSLDGRRYVGEIGVDAAILHAKSICVIAGLEFAQVVPSDAKVLYECRTIGDVARRPRDSFEKNIYARYGWLDKELPSKMRVVKIR